MRLSAKKSAIYFERWKHDPGRWLAIKKKGKESKKKPVFDGVKISFMKLIMDHPLPESNNISLDLKMRLRNNSVRNRRY